MLSAGTLSGMSLALLQQIEDGVLSNEPLSTLLQKVIVLGGRAGSEKMRDWARQELNGYPGIKDLPTYRNLHAQVKITLTNTTGYQPHTAPFSTGQLPEQFRGFLEEKKVPLEQVPINDGVGQIEAMANSGKDEHFLVPWWTDTILPLLNKHYVDSHTTRVRDVYWAVSNTLFQGLLVQIRSSLAELVAELVALTPDHAQPSKEVADAVVVYIINGDRAVINNLHQDARGGTATAIQGSQAPVTVAGENSTAIGNQTASGEGATVVGNQTASGEGSTITGRDARPAATESSGGFWKRWRKRGIVVGVATVVAAVAGVLTWLDWLPW